jgi:hypothetical protein
MPFQKGRKKTGGKVKGTPNQKTLQWEALGEAIATTHTDRFNSILASSTDEVFVHLYLNSLEYFKPKLSRAEHTGKDGADLPAPTIVMRGAK